MGDFAQYFIRAGAVVVILAVVALTETTKRIVHTTHPGWVKVRVRNGSGGQVVAYKTSGALLWNEVILHMIPALWGILLGLVRTEFLWNKLTLIDSVLMGGVLGAFSYLFMKILAKFLPKQYGVDVNLDEMLGSTPPTSPPQASLPPHSPGGSAPGTGSEKTGNG